LPKNARAVHRMRFFFSLTIAAAVPAAPETPRQFIEL
jgi:hypothetical protein